MGEKKVFFVLRKGLLYDLGVMYIHPGKILVKEARDARSLLNFISAK